MTFPIEVRKPRRATDDDRDNGVEWVYVYRAPGKLPPPVESKAMRLLDDLLRTLLFTRFGATSLTEIKRAQAQVIVDEMQTDGVRNLHEAVCWTYYKLMPDMAHG